MPTSAGTEAHEGGRRSYGESRSAKKAHGRRRSDGDLVSRQGTTQSTTSRSARNDHSKEEHSTKYPGEPSLHHLIQELRLDGPTGFIGVLRVTLASIEKALTTSHEQAIGLAVGHEAKIHRVLNEAGRLHMENAMLRAQMGWTPVPVLPMAPESGTKSIDGKTKSTEQSSLVSTSSPGGSGSHAVSPVHTMPPPGATAPRTNDDMECLYDVVGHTPPEPSSPKSPKLVENGRKTNAASEGGGGASQELGIQNPVSSKNHSPVGVWVAGDNAISENSSESVIVKADGALTSIIKTQVSKHAAPEHVGAPNGCSADRVGCDGKPTYTTVTAVDRKKPETPTGVPPELELPGLVDSHSDVRASIGSAMTGCDQDSVHSEDNDGEKNFDTACTLAIPGMEPKGEDEREVRISGLGPLPYEKQGTASTISRVGSNGICFEVLPVWRKHRKSTLHRLFSDRYSCVNPTDIHSAHTSMRHSSLPSQKNSFAGVRIDSAFSNEEPSESSSSFDSDEDDEEREKRRRKKKKPCRPKAVHPNSKYRGAWDVMTLFLVTYDTAAIPMQLFDPPHTIFLDFMAWFTRIMWSLDMLLSFVTGYMKNDGNVEMRLPYIARRYLLTWFLLDVCIVGADWSEVILTSMADVAGYARLGKSSRIFRILRLVRLMRLVRMRQVVRILTERLLSEILIILSDIFKSMTIIMGLAHLAACMWYGIGVSESETSTWVNHMPRGFATDSLGFRYAASLHWSLSQFSGGMDEIAPKNPRERVYAIGMFLVAFIVAAVFVSSLTSSMTRLLILGNTQTQNTFLLRRYLYQNGISNELSLRIQRNALYTLAERQKHVQESTIELLQLVSEPLRMELHFELYSPMMRCMPFFDRYIRECPHIMRKICHRAVTLQHVSHGDVLFTVGEIPATPKVYFIVNGQLEYVSIHGKVSGVAQKEYVGEAVLWTQWMHRGVLRAITEARLAVLDATVFQEIATEFDHPDFNPKLYACEYVAALNECGHDEVTDLPQSHDPLQRSSRDSNLSDTLAPKGSIQVVAKSELSEALRVVRSSLGAGIDAVRNSIPGGRGSIQEKGGASSSSPKALGRDRTF